MMPMSFHFGTKETILFKFWETDNIGSFFGSIILIALLGFAYEALKYWRDKLFQIQYTRSRIILNDTSTRASTMLDKFHLVQTFLHMIQFVIAYFLMLIFMTYNVWLALAVVTGTGVGYFTFGWSKFNYFDVAEHCQ